LGAAFELRIDQAAERIEIELAIDRPEWRRQRADAACEDHGGPFLMVNPSMVSATHARVHARGQPIAWLFAGNRARRRCGTGFACDPFGAQVF
jgi:hypothetical protein